MKDLVKIIKDNPGCIAVIDNDCWWINKPLPKCSSEWTDEQWDDWNEQGELVSHHDTLVPMKGTTYQSDNCYGGAILRALAEIVGIQIKSV